MSKVSRVRVLVGVTAIAASAGALLLGGCQGEGGANITPGSTGVSGATGQGVNGSFTQGVPAIRSASKGSTK